MSNSCLYFKCVFLAVILGCLTLGDADDCALHCALAHTLMGSMFWI